MTDLTECQQVVLAVFTLRRIPYHHAVFEDLGQFETVAVEDIHGAVQGAPRRHGVGDAALRQAAQRFARVG